MIPFERAKWVSGDGFDAVNTYYAFFDRVMIPQKTGKYLFRISVDTNYTLFINDHFIATGQYADYAFDKVYDELDVTDFLTAGENRFRIDCYHQGDDSSAIRGDTAGLIFELADERQILLASSEKTFAAPDVRYAMGPGVEHITGQLGYTFYYDSTKTLPQAIPCNLADKPMPGRARPIKKLEIGEDEPAELIYKGTFREKAGNSIGERMQNVSLSFIETKQAETLPSREGILLAGKPDEDGIALIVDLGREFAGIFSMDIDVPEDTLILVGWGEHLEDLRVRTYVGSRNFAASYTAHKGRNTFVNPFRRLGLRYLQLHIFGSEARLYYAGMKPTDYPMAHDVRFTCSDSLHNRIYEVCKRTLLLCAHEHYEDCPWREQALYTMDSRNQMLCGYYAFREFDFARASIRLLGQSLREDGLLELCSPARVPITIPSFTAIFLTQVYEYLQYSGDENFVREMLPVLQRIADGFVARMQNDKGLLSAYAKKGYWDFYEWQDGLSGSTESTCECAVRYDAPLCAFVSFGLRSFADTLTALGESRAEYYRRQHEKLNEAMNCWFWDEKQAAYASYMDENGEKRHYAELTNSLIIYADAAPEIRQRQVLDALAKERLIPATLSHSIFKYDVLMKEPEKYARYVFADVAEKWGCMLSHDATSFWETIDGASAFENAGSLCHGWSAIPAYLYLKYALNLDAGITGLYECQVKE